MILRKPYAFLIKHFRLIHLILAALVYYSIYCNKKLLDFFNEYSTTLIDVIGQDLSTNLISPFFKIVPLLIIVLLCIILAVMFIKKKPMLFYIINVLIYAYLFIIIIISGSILNKMSVSILNQRTILVIRDLIMAAFIVQLFSSIIITIRATGFDVRKFNFKEDLKDLDISEEDREEIEVEFGFDKNELIRLFRRTKRFAKYIYKENKLLANLGMIGLIFTICGISLILYTNRDKVLQQGMYFDTFGINMSVVDSYLVNTDYKGNKITDDYYLLIKLKMKSNKIIKAFDTTKAKIYIDDYIYTPTEENKNKMFDFGVIYRGENINTEYEIKSLIYKIPKELINKKIYFSLVANEISDNDKVMINYQDLTGISSNKSITITNDIQFVDSILPDYKINISAFDIKKQYKINYNFCVSNECINSYEYLKPGLNSNYDKALLKIKGVLYKETNDIDVDNLYEFMKNFGKIYYVVNGKKNIYYISNRVVSRRVNEKDTYYIEVSDEVLNAEKISIMFTIRNKNYEYILK